MTSTSRLPPTSGSRPRWSPAPIRRPPGRAARPARLRAKWRSGDPAREPQPHTGADGPNPGRDPPDRGRGGNPARGAAADAGRLLRDGGVPDRAPLLAPAADVAAGDDRDWLAPAAARPRGAAPAARSPDSGVRLRALHRESLP